MSWENPKTNWGQAGQTVPGADDFNRIEGNTQYLKDEVDSHKADTAVLIPKAGSTENNLLLDIVLTDKKKGSFKASATNTGNMSINGKPFKIDASTQIPAGRIKAGKVYDFYYDQSADSVFILAKASGNAQPSDVLAGKTFSNDDGEQVGSMINRSGNNIQSLLSEDVIIPEGFYSGAEKVIAPSVQAGDIGFTEWLSGGVFSTSWTKKLGYVVGISGVYRVSFDLQNNATYETAFARIYVNDSPRGIERYVEGNTPITFTEDITANAGDEIQLYARSSSSSQSARINNFRLTTNIQICVGKYY